VTSPLQGATLAALALLIGMPGCSPGQRNAPNPVAGWLAEGKRVAAETHQVELFLDSRDADTLGGIVTRVNERNAQSPLQPAELRAEVCRWGAVCGQVVASLFGGRWGEAKERNLRYGYSIWVPVSGGGWYEKDCFDVVEYLITSPQEEIGASIQQHLLLRFLH